MGLLELLQAGDVNTFNTTRGERTRLEFFAADLPGLDLSRVDLSGANVEKADLSESKLVGASLFRGRFTGIDGSNLDLTEALAQRTRFMDAWLEEAILIDAEFGQADFKEAHLVRSKATGARFIAAKLNQADVTEGAWAQVDLGEASCFETIFVKTDLTRAEMTDIKAGSANFTEARLDGIVATRGRFQEANFTGASLVAARLDEANLTSANLTGADLSGADLTGANLTGAVLTGAKLDGAVLANAVLDGVDLSGLELADVDLTGVDPTMLGLSDDQLDQVAAVGASVDPDAPLILDDIRAAANGEVVCVLWENADSEVERSIRFALCDGEVNVGVLPIGPDGVLARAVAPKGDGFEILLLQDRPGGTACLAYQIDRGGKPVNSRTFPLGYTPAIVPIVRSEGNSLLIYGMARRGPTLVVQRLDDEGLTPVHSETIATARGFLGRHQPVVACKGEVWMAVDRNGSSRPLGSPDGFPGERGVATPCGASVAAIWAEKPQRRKPGQLQSAVLVKRGTPDPFPVAITHSVKALDAVTVGTDIWVAWANETPDGLALFRCVVGGEPQMLPVPYGHVRDMRFAPDHLDAKGVPKLVVVSLDGRGTVVGEASLLGEIDG